MQQCWEGENAASAFIAAALLPVEAHGGYDMSPSSSSHAGRLDGLMFCSNCVPPESGSVSFAGGINL